MNLFISDKTIEIFSTANNNEKSPLVIIHTFQGEGKDVFEKCLELGCINFTLAAIGGLDWNRDLSPWETPEIRKNRYSFGGSDGYLRELCGKILPEILSKLPERPLFTAIAGYSLAGLFALYTAYKTDIFSRVASVSGSLWFPGFTEFAKLHGFVKTPDLIYLSLGDTEDKTRDKLLSSVRKNTEELAAFWHSKGINTVFELNPGNHFKDAVPRLAKGIKNLL